MTDNCPHIDSAAFHITAACSHTCPYCYMADVKASQPNHPPLERLVKVVDALAEAQVKEVNFVGGDPGMYPKMRELAEYCHTKGMTLSLLSNTHRYPGASVEAVAEHVSVFETTFHAPFADEHDSFCKSPGAYAYVCGRLRQALACGRKVGIVLNVIPQTVDYLFDIARVLQEREKLTIDYVLFQRIIPFGRAKAKSDFYLRCGHVERALDQIERIDKKLGIKVVVEDPFPLCLLPERVKKYMKPCQWGLTKAAVNDKGDLSRCGADPRGGLGNILETPLLEIWNKSPSLKAFREKAYLPEKCRLCSDLPLCGGGCPLSCETDHAYAPDILLLDRTVDCSVIGV